MSKCHPKKDCGQGGKLSTVKASEQSPGIVLLGRQRQKGQSTGVRPRCERCILSRKGRDSIQPVCGRCQKGLEPCKWPNGNPSRSGLMNLRMSERMEEMSIDDGAPRDGPAKNNMAKAQLTIRDQEVQGRSILENQILDPDAVVLTQQSSVDQQFQESLSHEMQRLEQVRMRVLKTTRAYLGTNPQLQGNTQERRGDGSEAEMRQSQEQMGVQGRSTQIKQDSDFMSSIGGGEAGTDNDDVLRSCLNLETL